MRRLFNQRVRRGLGGAARRGVALLAAAALLNLAVSKNSAANPPRPAPTGQVTVAAGLLVDGSPAVTGQTLFPGSSVATAERTTSALDLGNRARLELSGGTDLRLDFTEASVGGTLDAGGARVYAPRGVAPSLTTADATVAGDAAEAALFSLRVGPEGTTLSVQEGRVEMRAGGVTRTVVAGESLRSSRGSAPAPPQGNSLSSRKRTGLFIGIAAALAAVILVVTGRDDEEEEIFGGCPIILSPTDGPPPPCF